MNVAYDTDYGIYVLLWDSECDTMRSFICDSESESVLLLHRCLAYFDADEHSKSELHLKFIKKVPWIPEFYDE